MPSLSFRAKRSGAEKSPGEQLPVDVRRNAAMSSRKPFTGCFPPTGIYENIPHLLLLPRSFAVAQDDRWEAGRKSQNTMVPCRTGNYTQTVSCCDETRWFHVGQETIREQFPAVMKHDGAMSSLSFRAESRNLPVNSFLPRRNTMVPCRTGNYTRKVSCRGETRWCHVGQETIRKQFPAPMNHHIAAPSRKLIFRRKIV